MRYFARCDISQLAYKLNDPCRYLHRSFGHHQTNLLVEQLS